MKTHYELLGLEPTADAETIKRAFRREIARYHPDKVVHLGAEFQEMAATRASELTVAYKTLTDDKLRAEYDAGLSRTSPPNGPPPPAAAPSAAAETPPTIDDIRLPDPPGDPARFQAERSDRDAILRRAIASRVRSSVETLFGKCETPAVRGFDLATVPLARPRFLGAAPPRVLVRIVPAADAAAVSSVYNDASRAALRAGKSPVVVLLFSRTIAPHTELAKAWDASTRQRRGPEAPRELSVIVVDVADWSCRLPPNCPAAARELAGQLCVP